MLLVSVTLTSAFQKSCTWNRKRQFFGNLFLSKHRPTYRFAIINHLAQKKYSLKKLCKMWYLKAITLWFLFVTMYDAVHDYVWLLWQTFKSRTTIRWGTISFVSTTRMDTELLVLPLMWFYRCWPFVREIHRWLDSSNKSQQCKFPCHDVIILQELRGVLAHLAVDIGSLCFDGNPIYETFNNTMAFEERLIDGDTFVAGPVSRGVNTCTLWPSNQYFIQVLESNGTFNTLRAGTPFTNLA